MSGLAWLRRIGEYPGGPGYPTEPSTPRLADPRTVDLAVRLARLETRLAEVEAERDAAWSVVEAVRVALARSTRFGGQPPADVVSGVEWLVAAMDLVTSDHRGAVESRDKVISRADAAGVEVARLTAELEALRPRMSRSPSADLEQALTANTQLAERLAEAHTTIDRLSKRERVS